MKGIVFTTFNDMIEQKIGIEMWEDLLEQVKSESQGIYTAVEDFPDEELLEMVSLLSEKTGTPLPDLIQAFGQYLFHTLAMKHSIFVEAEKDLFDFLKSIEGVIHKEVMKLYPDPKLPTIDWKQENEKELTLLYKSPRKLCHLADGLIRGAAEQYETPITLTHDQCMHDGHEQCTFVVTRHD